MNDNRDDVFRRLNEAGRTKKNGNGGYRTDAPPIGKNGARAPRLKLTLFDGITMKRASDCVIEGLIPKGGFVVVWGPPKCGESFIAFDWAMQVALGLAYRGLYVEQGTVVYCALEGGGGLQAQRGMDATPRPCARGTIPAVLLAQRPAGPRSRAE